MTLRKRTLLALCCLAIGSAGQVALQAHLNSGMVPVALRRQLAEFPMTIPATQVENEPNVSQRAWSGEDQPESATLSAKLPFADAFIARYYHTTASDGAEKGAITARLYAVYSQKGEDREHHPEICMRDVAGYPEDTNARGLVYLDPQKTRAVQRFRFKIDAGQYTNVYYWHYTLAAENESEKSFLQLLHGRFGARPPSVTVQVSTSATGEDVKQIESSFLVTVDQVMRSELLPASAQLGCDRLPVRLIMRQ